VGLRVRRVGHGSRGVASLGKAVTRAAIAAAVVLPAEALLAPLNSPSSSGGPDAPTRVAATGWNASAIVRWRAPSSTGASPIVQYRVVASPGGSVAIVPATQSWGKVSGLSEGVSYTFRVSTINQENRRSAASLPSNPVTPQPVAIRVQGNQLLNASGERVRLFGFNRSGTEYACVVKGAGGTPGLGIFDGPSDVASIETMASWHVNAVRVSLNEDCWLGINGVNPAYAGVAYQGAIGAYVTNLNAAGLVAILDLHWNAPGGDLAVSQQVMADADNSPAFWASVAEYFKGNPGVIFDLYNEPRDISWACWRNGCQTTDGWATAGMQALIAAVRSTGATQPIMVGGLNHANDLSSWLGQRLFDPLAQLIASVHVYNAGQPPHYCSTVACWSATLAPVAKRVPVVTGELGESDRASSFITTYLTWAEDQWAQGRSVSSIAFAWDAALGEGGPSVIAAWDGTPTRFGLGFRSFLNGLFWRGEIVEG